MSDAVYVADTWNNRIQKWSKNAQEGITVAGSSNGSYGYDAALLNNPVDIFVDTETGVLYIADTYNRRIQRWLPGALKGDTIVGGFDNDNPNTQMMIPVALTFDSEGNLFVTDINNHRVQKFALIDNTTCSSTSTGTLNILF
ncbi:unnamed protein product [Rotaria sp. Silwood1]|nr:unnamed protein product [Rotaria sp. Silwood1]CAF1517047.1 unnamed protein product [Rotaria sp. Silwood1]CAF3681282.1 unnamed protein product [Rotaria sp. Silwood1]CAF4842285.1 unnamed protein product [Rotaria sp. Silwood1]